MLVDGKVDRHCVHLVLRQIIGAIGAQVGTIGIEPKVARLVFKPSCSEVVGVRARPSTNQRSICCLAGFPVARRMGVWPDVEAEVEDDLAIGLFRTGGSQDPGHGTGGSAVAVFELKG